jgi:hypothetical protein
MIKKVTFFQKLFIWSLLIEPLGYFTVSFFGIELLQHMRFSRILQLIVLVILSVSILIKVFQKSSNLRLGFDIKLFSFWAVVIISTSLSFANGFYESKIAIRVIEFSENIEYSQFRIYFQPLKEIANYAYMIIYMLLLPKYVISNSYAVDYFFKLFRVIFYLTLIAGFVGLSYAYVFDLQLFDRHLSYDEKFFIGYRFHGILGEPRDAMVFLVYALAIINLERIINGNNKLIRTIYLLCFLAFSTSQSGSFLIGIVMFPFIYVFFHSEKIKLLHPRYIFWAILGLVFVYFAITVSTRVSYYWDQIIMVPYMLENQIALPSRIKNQMVNIYAFWVLYKDIISFDFIHPLIGYGAAASAMIKPETLFGYDWANPHAQIPRLILEFGLIGSFLWVSILVKPIFKLKKYLSLINWNRAFFLTIFLCASSLAHRSHLIYIYVGLIYSVYNVYFEHK